MSRFPEHAHQLTLPGRARPLSCSCFRAYTGDSAGRPGPRPPRGSLVHGRDLLPADSPPAVKAATGAAGPATPHSAPRLLGPNAVLTRSARSRASTSDLVMRGSVTAPGRQGGPWGSLASPRGAPPPCSVHAECEGWLAKSLGHGFPSESTWARGDRGQYKRAAEEPDDLLPRLRQAWQTPVS